MPPEPEPTPNLGVEVPDDAMLMAFADGELPPESAAALARRIAADPALARKVAAFRGDRALLRAALDPVLAEPVPERLLATLRRPAPGAGPVVGPAMAGAHRRPTVLRPVRGRQGWAPLALAASIALLLGYGAGRLGAPDGALPAPVGLAGLAETAELARLAETAPSGASAPLPGGASGILLATVRLPDGRFCREVEILGDGSAGTALLCRAGAGRWSVQALAAAPAQPAGTSFAPAAGGSGDPLAPLWVPLGATPLDGPAEAAALASGWR